MKTMKKIKAENNLPLEEDLRRHFKGQEDKIRPAVEAMIADAKRAAAGEGEFYTYEDVFGTEDRKLRRPRQRKSEKQ